MIALNAEGLASSSYFKREKNFFSHIKIGCSLHLFFKKKNNKEEA